MSPSQDRRECSISENKSRCTCTYEPCSRKGRCCECISYHHAKRQVPGCLFPPEFEKTYDRSVANFIRSQNG